VNVNVKYNDVVLYNYLLNRSVYIMVYISYEIGSII